MRDELDVELAELYPARETDAATLQAIKDQLFAEPKKPRYRWTGAAAAVVLLLCGIVVFFRLPQPQQPLATTSLTDLADRLDASPAPAGRYRHVTQRIQRTHMVEVDATRWYAWADEYVVEVWIPLADNEDVREVARPVGKPRWLGGTEPESVLLSTAQEPLATSFLNRCRRTPCLDADKPRDPGQLLALLHHDITAPHGVFERATELLNSAFTTKDVRATTYRALAQVPRVKYSGEWIYADTLLDGGRKRLKVDPASGRYLGYEERADSPSRLPPDTVLRSVEITEDGTDHLP